MPIFTARPSPENGRGLVVSNDASWGFEKIPSLMHNLVLVSKMHKMLPEGIARKRKKLPLGRYSATDSQLKHERFLSGSMENPSCLNQL